MAQGAGRAFPEVPDRPSPASLYPWIFIASGTAGDAIDGKFHPSWLAIAGLAAFAVLYLGSLRVRWRSSRPRASYWLLGALGAVTLALSIGFGQGMAALFPLLSIACGAVVPWVMPKSGHGPPAPLLVVFIVAAVSTLIAIAQGASPGTSGRAGTARRCPVLSSPSSTASSRPSPSCAGPGRNWPGPRWTPSGSASPGTCTTCSGTPCR